MSIKTKRHRFKIPPDVMLAGWVSAEKRGTHKLGSGWLQMIEDNPGGALYVYPGSADLGYYLNMKDPEPVFDVFNVPRPKREYMMRKRKRRSA